MRHLGDSNCSNTTPNILMIFSDDQGHTDLRVTGVDTFVDTPVLDNLAALGARFTYGYSTAPTCVPSRAGLLSGRNQNEFGLYTNDADVGYGNAALPPRPQVTTIAERLQERGYVTGLAGKWDLAGHFPDSESTVGHRPGDRGFDEYLNGMVSTWYTNIGTEGAQLADRVQLMYFNTSNRIDISADFVERFVARHYDEPFFMYWAPFGPHIPMLQDGDPYLAAFPKPHYAWYNTEENDRRHRALALVKAIDTRTGSILNQLREHGVEETTLVLFASDNGAPIAHHYDEQKGFYRDDASNLYMGSDNVPLRGAKGFLWEGGIRVPMLAYWKGTINPGQVIDEPVTTLDFTATMAHAAGLSTKTGFDGRTLLPRLVGEAATVVRPGGMFTHFWTSMTGDAVVRHGDYKIRRCRSNASDPNISLDLVYFFNITADPFELESLPIGEHKQLYDMLTGKLDEWEASLPFAVSCPPRMNGEIFIRRASQTCAAAQIDPRFVVDGEATCYPGMINGHVDEETGSGSGTGSRSELDSKSESRSGPGSESGSGSGSAI